MATGMTKTQLVRHMAEKNELNNKQAAAFLEALAEVAIKETKKNGVFIVPGLGRLVKSNRKARMGRNPQTGEAIKIPAKTVVKFRVAKAAKDAIAPKKELFASEIKAGRVPAFSFVQRMADSAYSSLFCTIHSPLYSSTAAKKPSHGCTPGIVRRYFPWTSESTSFHTSSPLARSCSNSSRESRSRYSGASRNTSSTTASFSSCSREHVE